tara:strand:+ start:19957 stop:33864 length:13908 start_codon:yes stop_codon:yes gene_type:complete
MAIGTNKKSGIVSPDLIQPGDDNYDNVVNTTEAANSPVAEIPKDIELNTSLIPKRGVQLENIDHSSYSKYIDRPFSYLSDDADDLRAYNQTTGEKLGYMLPKLVTRTGTNVLGSTVGLVYGGGAFLGGLFDKEESATKSFFDNDFQRSMDGINDWMDGALPHYYTKEEADNNFWKSMGTANFWANDFSQGLSFVAGAVISEYLTVGMATSAIAARATNLFRQVGKATRASKGAKYSQAGTKVDDLKKQADSLLRRKKLGNAAVTMRQLGTGAMYEAGVEARHHYDMTLSNLEGSFHEEYGRDPNTEEMAHLVDIATKSSNAVFGANVALVGYGNYMMFPKIFGKGFNATKNSFKGKIGLEMKEGIGKWKALYKDVSKKRAFGNSAWRVLKTPLYEGFVEEGGQKLADLSGQHAAERYYRMKEDPTMLGMIGELLGSTDDAFMEAYGSNEGQKEIGIGFILAALGLPGRGETRGPDGKVIKDANGKTKTGWKPLGGVLGTIQDMKYEKKMLDAHVNNLNKDENLLGALKNAKESMVRAGVIQDDMDFAQIINSDYGYKNAEHDNMFNFINARLASGHEAHITEQIDNIRNMTVGQFREAFSWNGSEDLNDAELSEKKGQLADMMEERTADIKETRNKVNGSFVNYNQETKDAIVHALAVGKDSDSRESSMNKAIKDILGFDPESEMEHDSRSIQDEAEDVGLKVRIKRLWERMSPAQKTKILALPEAKAIMRKVGLEAFTDPTHVEDLMMNLIQERKRIYDEIEQLNSDETVPRPAVYKGGKNIGGNEEQQKKWARLENLNSEYEKINEKTNSLLEAINKGLDPDLSASEQAQIDKYKENDPTGYATNKEKLIQMFKDSRKIRARRHRAINMVNELMDYRDHVKQPGKWYDPRGLFIKAKPGTKVPLPKMLSPQMIRDVSAENAEDITDHNLKRLFIKYQGKVIEFEYTKADKTTVEGLRQTAKEAGIEDSIVNQVIELMEKNPELDELTAYKTALKTAGISINDGPKTGIYRFYVKPGKVKGADDNVLIAYPSKENVDLLIERQELVKLKGNKAADARIEEIDLVLSGQGFITDFTIKNLGFLNSATNIKEVTESDQVSEIIESATTASREEIQNELARIQSQIDKFTEKLELLALDLAKQSENKTKLTPTLKKNLAAEIANVNEEYNSISEQLANLEVQKVQLQTKLDDLVTLNNTVLSAKDTVEDLGGMTPQEKEHAINIAVQSKITDYLKDRFKKHADIMKEFVGKGFFKDLDLLSDEFRTEEDESRLYELANMIFDFANTNNELPVELISLLDEGMADIKYKIDQAKPLINKLMQQIHFVKTGTENGPENYDHRFRNKDEQSRRAILESVLADVHELKMKYESAKENLRDKLRLDLAPIFDEINKQNTLNERYKATNDTFIANYSAVMEEIKRLTTPVADELLGDEARTSEGEMTDEELERDIELNGKVYYNSPSVLKVKLAKTAGNHSEALRKYKELAEKPKRTKAEQEQFEHYRDQNIFYDWVARSNNDKTNSRFDNHNLVPLTRKSVIEFDAQQENAENKVGQHIGFYDHNKSKPKTSRYSKSVDKNGNVANFSERNTRDESLEDIVVLVVDDQGVPIKHEGNIVYASLMGTETYRTEYDEQGMAQQTYRFGKADLVKVNGTIPHFTKKINGRKRKFFTGQMSEEAKAIVQQHKAWRQSILEKQPLIYLNISGKSHGMQSYGEQGLDHKGFARETIVQREQDVKNIDLRVSVNPDNKISYNAKQFTVRAGFLYALKDGNLIRFKTNKLPKNIQLNVYNTLKLFAKQVEDSKLPNTTMTEPFLFPGTDQSITKQLSDLIYFGKHAKGRTNGEYSIYTEGDTLYYGGQSMTFKQLVNSDAHPESHAALKNFLAELYVQVNARHLTSRVGNKEEGVAVGDQAVREDHGKKIQGWYLAQASANKKIKKTRKKIKKKKGQTKEAYRKELYLKSKLTKEEKLALKSNKPSPQYSQYVYHEVSAKLEVKNQTWDNYTHFLMGSKSTDGNARTVHEIPVTVNMVRDTHMPTKTTDSFTNPQFQGQYLTFNSNSRNVSFSDLSEPASIPKHRRQDVNELVITETEEGTITPINTPLEGKAPSGVIEGKQYVFTIPENKTKLKFEVESINHDNQVLDFQVLDITNAQGKTIPLENFTNEMQLSMRGVLYAEQSAKSISSTKQEKLEESEKNKTDLTDLNDIINNPENDRPTTGEDVEGASMRTSTLAALQEDYEFMNFSEEYEKFKTLVPKDSAGNPIFKVEVIQGLVHGRDFGYFSKTGDILLSNEAQRGALYHEAFHGITYKFLSEAERAELYTEVRSIRGKQRTYKGDLKELKNFTDLEADEWLAEEFRHYTLNEGEYNIGSKVEKSLIQRLFDFLFKFFNNLKNSKVLFDRIYSGHFNHGVEEFVSYDIAEALKGRGGASMSAYRGNSATYRDLNNGITVALFDMIHKNDEFGIEEIFELAAQPEQLEMALAQHYGTPGDHGKRTSVGSLLIEQNNTAWNALNRLQKESSNEGEIRQLQKEKEAIDSVRTIIKEEWSTLLQRNILYLKQFKLNIKSENIEDQIAELNAENTDHNKDSVTYKPSNQIDLKKTVKPSIKLLLGTLPRSITNHNNEPLLKTNKSGTYELTPSSEVITTLYKHLSNKSSVDEMYETLVKLAKENITYQILLKRLGIAEGLESVVHESFSPNKLRLLFGLLKVVNNSNEEYGTLLAKKHIVAEENPGRFINDSNTEKAENITKNRWNYNFKKIITNSKLGTLLPDGRRVLNINKKFKIGTRTATFKEFSTYNLDINDMIPLLQTLGIEFYGLDNILQKIEKERITNFMDIASWVIGDVIKNEGDVSTIFGGDVEGNLKSLIGFEVDNSTLAITLQHVNPKGEQVFGINRKHYINILADRLNEDPDAVEALVQNSPFLFGSLFLVEPTIKIKTLEGGKNLTQGKGFDISKTTKANVAGLHIASILDGYVPLIQTGNKKTVRAIKVGDNKYRSDKGMREYLSDLLKAEILTAHEIKRNPKIQQIPELRTKGIQLQFFNDAALFPVIYSGSKTYINAEILDQETKKFNDFIESEEVQKEIASLLLTRQREALDVLKKYGIISKGKDNSFNNIGIDDVHIQQAYESLPEGLKNKAITKNGKISRSVIENLSKHIGNNQLIGMIEQTRLFLGHPALYMKGETYRNMFKRTSGMVGSKVYPMFNEYILEALNNKYPSGSISTTGVPTNHSHRPVVRMVTRAEYTKDSEYLNMYTQRLAEMGRDDVIDAIEETFVGMEVFDGGGLVSFDFYRSVLLMTDNWSNKHERAYQKIVQGVELAPNEAVSFPPLKPQVFADIKVGGMGLKLFNKFALYPIHPNLSKLAGFKGQATVMDDVYDDMIKNDIDYTVFESGTKVGGKQNSKHEFEPLIDPDTGAAIPLSNDLNYIQEFPLEYFGIQLDPSDNKNQVPVGTQSATMLFMNVFESGFLNSEHYPEDFIELETKYQNIHTSMIDKDTIKLADKLGFRKTPDGFDAMDISKEKMLAAVSEEMNKRDLPEHMKDSVNALFESELSYTNLLANKQKIDELLYSIVTNTVIARKINGNMNTLQADVGFTVKVATDAQLDIPGYRPLKFYEFEKDGKTVKAMEVYLPHHLKSEYGSIVDINELTEEAKEIIGFRIPTEGLNSIEYIKVAGFLEHTMGPAVVVPHEMVAKSGADYDIDKLTLYLPHIERNEDGKIDVVKPVKTPYELSQRDSASFKASAVKLFGTDVEGLAEFFKLYEKGDPAVRENLANSLYKLGWENLEDAFKQPGEVVENMLLTSMKNVLKHEASFPQLISPVGAFTLSSIAHEIHDAQLGHTIDGVIEETGNLLDMLSISNLIETTYQMHQTLGGTGIVATSITDMAKSQRSGFSFNLESKPDILIKDDEGEKYLLNFEGLETQPIQLGRVFDTEGNLINSSMQQYISAYVDGEKDPFAMYVNAGQQGAGVHMLLIRAGVPLPTVLKFMAQPVIQQYYKLKNLQSISNEQSLYKQALTEGAIVEKIKKLVGEPKMGAAFNEEALDKHDIVNGIPERSETSMLITNLKDMEGGQKQLQSQVFEDFLKYKKYAELVRKAQRLAAFDTSKLQNGYNLIYLVGLESYLLEQGVFNNLDAKTGIRTEITGLGQELQTAPFLKSLKAIYDQSPQLFKQTDLKENVKYSDGEMDINPLKLQMVLMAKNMIEDSVSEDDILYRLRSFDNFITAWTWQTRRNTEQVQLNERIAELFQGPTSLPRRLAEAQDKYPDNILVRDLLPVLQEFESELNQDFSIDKLQLLNRKYSSDEVQDVADSWYELYHMGGEAQQLAEDIIDYSLIKSGTDFHPNSFFHILPGVEILAKTAPMLETVHDAIHNVKAGRELLDKRKSTELYEEWLSNSWDNPRIVRTIFDVSYRFKTNFFETTQFNDEIITIKSIRDISDRKGIVGAENRYFSATFKRVSLDKKSGTAQYQMITKKGILGHIKEIGTGKSSIIEANNYPFGRQTVNLPTKYLNKILAKKQNWLSFPMNLNNKNMVREGVITTPTGVDISIDRVFHSTLQDLYSSVNYLNFGVQNRAELQTHIATNLGYKNWAEFAKDSHNKGFMKKGDRKQFFNATVLKSAPAQNTKKNDITEAPVTQSLESLQPGYNQEQC